MTKRQLIEEIRTYNPTAAPRFLGSFDDRALRQYLENLKGATSKRVQVLSLSRRPVTLRMVS